MSVLEIRTFPDPVLLSPAQEVTAVDDRVQRFLDDMADTMYHAAGVGLAAPQVGVPQSILVIDISPRQEGSQLITLINPSIIGAEGEDELEEGCLSIPEFTANVIRHRRVTVSGIDRAGKLRLIEAEGMLARALQHEIDHLRVVLIIDHLRGLKREMTRKKLRKKFADPSS
jgi:peptide deformylase